MGVIVRGCPRACDNCMRVPASMKKASCGQHSVSCHPISNHHCIGIVGFMFTWLCTHVICYVCVCGDNFVCDLLCVFEISLYLLVTYTVSVDIGQIIGGWEHDKVTFEIVYIFFFHSIDTRSIIKVFFFT